MKRIHIISGIILFAVVGWILLQQRLWSSTANSVSGQAPAASQISGANQIPAQTQEQVNAAYGRLPLSFEENRGQTAGEVRFLTRSNGYNLFLTTSEAVLVFQARVRGYSGEVLRMKLAGANPKPAITGLDQMSGQANYIAGNDPTQWQTNIPTYGKVKYVNVYPGIDQIYYGNQQQLEYDLIVAPGSNPGAIRLVLEGGGKPRVLKNGDLVVIVNEREIRLTRPVAYQEGNAGKEWVACHYALTKDGEVQLKTGAYDRRRELVIDPVLRFSTYLGGSGTERIYDIAVDALGNAYVTGWAFSNDFPVTPGAYQPTPRPGDGTVFVTKINSSGTALIYSTYIGAGGERGNSIALDKAGNAYITGYTWNASYPTTAGAFQKNCYGSTCTFITKLNSTGSGLIYSTFLSAYSSTQGFGIAVDAA